MINYETIPADKRDMIKNLIVDLALELKPEVEKIESRIATTKAHYGDYMSLLSNLSTFKRQLFACALLDAGANSEGVSWALRLLGGE